jgi:hypothetical protein
MIGVSLKSLVFTCVLTDTQEIRQITQILYTYKYVYMSCHKWI